MNRSTSIRKIGGFTLIEILVSLILLAVLVAAVFPVLTQQSGKANSPRLGVDLRALQTAVQQYVANTKGKYPTSIGDLVNDPTETGWDGPYLEVAVATGAASTAPVITGSGYDVSVENGLFCYPKGNTTPAAMSLSCTNGDFVAARLTGLTSTEEAAFDTDIDGAVGTTSGKVRRVGSDVFYLLTVYKS